MKFSNSYLQIMGDKVKSILRGSNMKSDLDIKKNVMEELEFTPSVSSGHIGVAVGDGIVTLTGRVSTLAEKFAVEKACFRVYGVKAIADELEVVLAGNDVRSDVEIAKAAAEALSWDVLVPPGVQVTVEKGKVILRGTVDWAYQRRAAEKSVRNLKGITSVTNEISIQTKVPPKVEPQIVKDKIEHALLRMADQEAKKIQVNVVGGKVILSGMVKSRDEIENAKWAAWSVQGVTEIENRLRLS